MAFPLQDRSASGFSVSIIRWLTLQQGPQAFVSVKPSSRNLSPIREARAWRCLFSQGEREFGRAGVLDSTSSTRTAFNPAKMGRSASAAVNR